MPGLALPDAARGDVGNVSPTASRAGNPIRPAASHKVGNAVVRVSEIDNGFFKCLWFLHDALIMGVVFSKSRARYKIGSFTIVCRMKCKPEFTLNRKRSWWIWQNKIKSLTTFHLKSGR